MFWNKKIIQLWLKEVWFIKVVLPFSVRNTDGTIKDLGKNSTPTVRGF